MKSRSPLQRGDRLFGEAIASSKRRRLFSGRPTLHLMQNLIYLTCGGHKSSPPVSNTFLAAWRSGKGGFRWEKMMGNGGMRFSLVLGERSKGRDLWDKREILGKRKGLLALRNPGEKKKERKIREKGEKRENPSENQHHLEKRKEILYSKELIHSNHLWGWS